MLKKKIAALSMCAVILLAAAPSQAFAQTLAQSQPEESEQNLHATRAKPKPDLKAAFAEELAKIKADPLTEADIKRLEKGRQDPQSTAKPKTGMSKGTKTFLIVFLSGMAVLIVVLAIKGVDNPIPRCELEPDEPNCLPGD